MAEYHGAKDPAWGRFLIVWALVLLLLGGAGCYLLYQYLGVYEVTRPDPVMDDFIKNTELTEIIDMAKENIPFELTEFEDPRDLYTSYVEAIDLSRAVNYRVNSGKSEPEHIVYDVRSGPNLICEVFLEPDGDTPGFGRNYWSVSGVQAAKITDFLSSVTAQIETVSGTELALNGVSLTETYLSGKPKAIQDLTRYEAEMENPPHFLTYEVGPLYGEITLTDANGGSVAPEGEVHDGQVVYHTFDGKQDLTITAPDDLPVFINGVELSKDDSVSSTLGVFKGLELYTGDADCLTTNYRIEGLYLTPTVTAVDFDGTEVTPIATSGDTLLFFHHGEPETEALMYSVAESFFNAYMEYSAHAFEYTRYANLLNKILPQSDLYQYVFRSQEAMYWASGTQTEYNDLRYENFHMVSPYCFTCTVIYSADMTAKNWYEQYSYMLENAYELSFVSTNGRWLAAGMNVITGA